MSEIHRRRPRRNKFEFSFVGNDCRPSQKSGTRRENRNAPDSPDLSSSIPDDRGYLLSLVFISRQNLGQSGNGKIPDRLGFSRHMKTRLKIVVSVLAIAATFLSSEIPIEILNNTVFWSFKERSVQRKAKLGGKFFHTLLLSRLSHKFCRHLSLVVLFLQP